MGNVPIQSSDFLHKAKVLLKFLWIHRPSDSCCVWRSTTWDLWYFGFCLQCLITTSLQEMQVTTLLLRSMMKYALFSVIPKWDAFRTPFSSILKGMNIYKRKENPWCWSLTQLTVFPGQISSPECWVPGFAVLPWSHSLFPMRAFLKCCCAGSRAGVTWAKLRMTQSSVSFRVFRAQNSFFWMKSRQWHCQQDLCERRLSLQEGHTGLHRGRHKWLCSLWAHFNSTKWDVGCVEVTSDCPNHSKWCWSIVKSIEQLGSASSGELSFHPEHQYLQVDE